MGNHLKWLIKARYGQSGVGGGGGGGSCYFRPLPGGGSVDFMPMNGGGS